MAANKASIRQEVWATATGVCVRVSNPQGSLIRAVLYGDPTEDEVQRALEAFTAWKLDLTTISEVRRHAERALSEAMRRYYESPVAREKEGRA